MDEYKYSLEEVRKDKLKALGIVCYNLYIDRLVVLSETENSIISTKNIFEKYMLVNRTKENLGLLNVYEAKIEEKLVNIGCICFNLYVDARLFDERLASGCREIASINYEINCEANYKKVQASRKVQSASDNLKQDNLSKSQNIPKRKAETTCTAEDTHTSQIQNQNKSKRKKIQTKNQTKIQTQNDFNAHIPYGMELIPAGFKKCICSYKNKPEARFCGKCGAKLA